MATIHDIAQISGYSIGTVSRVINNRADVSEKARKKIEAVIREQGFQPNSSARTLRQSMSSEVYIVVRGIANTFLQSLLEKTQIRICEHGESAGAQFIKEAEDEVAVAAKIMQAIKPKGLVFLGGNTDTFQQAFSGFTVPSVLISADAESLGFDNLSSFTTDDRDAGGCAARALVSKGHRRINGPSLRIRGAVEELERSGVSFDFARDYEPCPFSAEAGFQAAKRLLSRTPDLTAAFAISDSLAIGAMRAFRDMGLHIPRDISLVGFDGVVATRYTIPRLATIEQDVELLARRGVDDLLMRISYEGPAVHEKIPYRFVNGESIAQPR